MSDTEGVKMVAKIFKESTLKKVLQNIIDDYSYFFFFKANRNFGTIVESSSCITINLVYPGKWAR